MCVCVCVCVGGGLLKVVVATNSAETSLTIDDVTVVVDTERHKEIVCVGGVSQVIVYLVIYIIYLFFLFFYDTYFLRFFVYYRFWCVEGCGGCQRS